MRVTVITVCFNNEKTIADTISSVWQQEYEDIEHIIIDGGSTDKTLFIAGTVPKRNGIILSEKDQGIYDAMNKGINQATGDLIAFLNADDFYFDKFTIAKVVDRIKSSHADALYGDLVYVHPNKTEKVFRYWKAGSYQAGKFKKGWMPPHPTFFAKKALFRQFGGFNLALKSAADYELMLRFIHKNKCSVVYLPEVLVKMRTGGKSNASIKNRIRANKEDLEAWYINGLKPIALFRLLKPLSKIHQLWS